MHTSVLFLAAIVPSGEPAPQPHPAEVTAADVRRSVERALPFLDKSSAAWRSERKCVTCHQVPFTVWALTEAKNRGFAVEPAKLEDLTAWAFNFCATDNNKGDKTGGFHLTSAFMILSQNGAAREDALQTYVLFETLFAKRQKPDGSWREGRQIRVPGAQREADEVDTMWTLLAIKSLDGLGDKLPAETRKGLSAEREKGLAFLKAAKPGKRVDWLLLRALVAKEYESAERAKELAQELLSEQNPDGGWGYIRGGSSYAHTTGEVLYCLVVMGFGERDVPVRKAWKYLVQTQQSDGWWHAPSREVFGSKPDKAHEPSIHWGTAWATIGLVHTLPKK
jgi:hypothetical protein